MTDNKRLPPANVAQGGLRAHPQVRCRGPREAAQQAATSRHTCPPQHSLCSHWRACCRSVSLSPPPPTHTIPAVLSLEGLFSDSFSATPTIVCMFAFVLCRACHSCPAYCHMCLAYCVMQCAHMCLAYCVMPCHSCPAYCHRCCVMHVLCHSCPAHSCPPYCHTPYRHAS